MGNLTNDIGEAAGRVNRARKAGGLHGLVLTNTQHDGDDPRRGSLVLATPATATGTWVWPAWPDGRLLKFWEAIAWEEKWPPTRRGDSHTGTVGVEVELAPGGKATVPFLIAWHFPNYPHWRAEASGRVPTWKNWYATRWADAWAVAAELAYGDLVAVKIRDVELRRPLFLVQRQGRQLPLVYATFSTLLRQLAKRLNGL